MSTNHLRLQPDTSADEEFARELETVEKTVIKPIVRRKLNVSLFPGDTGSRNQEALELVSDIRLRLLTEIDARVESKNNAIRDLGAYAATIAFNACHNHFRERYPRRASLRNKLKYLLRHHTELSLWRDPANGWLCGLVEWEGRTDVVESHHPNESGLSQVGTERHSSARLLKKYFADRSGPVVFDELVNDVAEANGLIEPTNISAELSDTTYPIVDLNMRADKLVELRSRLTALWEAVRELPLAHRKALLLNLRDDSGDNLLAALPLTGAASIREIATSLELNFEELAEIWNSLPWDDNRIARHLGGTRQQVINLRQTARAKLIKQLTNRGNI